MMKTIVLMATGVLATMLALPAPANAAHAAVAGPANVLAGPGAKCQVLAQYPQGTLVDVVWCDAENTGCLVQRRGKKGWMALDDLKLRQGGKAVEVSDGGDASSNGGSVAEAVGQPVAVPGSAEAATLETAAPGDNHSSLTIDKPSVLNLSH